MSCGCNNGKPNEIYDRMPYMRQTPAFHHCCPPPPPLFMPFQPPPWFGPCFPPPPRQAGPWEYTPSRMYPAPPPCGSFGLPHVQEPYPHFWANYWGHPWHQHWHPHPTFRYQCMPQQAPVCGCMGPMRPVAPMFPHDCGCHHKPIWPNPIGPMPPIPPRPLPPPPPDKPEIALHPKRIVAAVPTENHEAAIVQYSDGQFDVIANGYVPIGGGRNNGPKCGHIHDIRGNISDSEGLDTVNFQFNTSDAGSSF